MISFCGCLHSFGIGLIAIFKKSNHLQYKQSSCPFRLCLIYCVILLGPNFKVWKIILSAHCNKIEFWTSPARSSKHDEISITSRPANPHKTRLNQIRKGYFFFDLFYLFLAFKKRINQKQIAYFQIGCKACFMEMR